jgi:hypothetical protein
MEKRLHDLHLQAGLASGREKTCGQKTAYETEEHASRSAAAHNRWAKRKHDVEPYPCAFCHKWHIGGIMPVELLEAIAAASAASGDSTGLIS